MEMMENRAGFIEQVSAILNADMGISSEISVGDSLLVVGSGDLVRDFVESCGDRFSITIMPNLASFSGSLGDFRVKISDSTKHIKQGDSAFDSSDCVESFSQIVFFNGLDRKPQLGIYFISDYESKDDLIDDISRNIGDFEIDKTILFDDKKCQYSHRQKTEFSYCKDCVEVCPTMAISSDDENRLLLFSQVDCILCGKCVCVCPSGAMQKANATLDNLHKALKLYKDKIVVVCENIEDFELFSQKFKVDSTSEDCKSSDCKNEADSTREAILEDIFPLVLPSVNLLNYAYLLSIVQESGRVCVVCGEIDKQVKESIDFINDIYQRILGKVAVFEGDSMDFRRDFRQLAESLPFYHYARGEGEFLRESFANRIRFLVKGGSFGALKNSLNIIYTDLKIDTAKCTLCNACVESCNANALINAKDNFSLLLNPSLCTACGYCIDTCAEKCLDMSFDGFVLDEKFLNYRILAKDEPFRCVECGEIFATNKSIQKVKNILQNAFVGDEIKLKSIECCEKCKVKIMFASPLNNQTSKL